VGQGAGKVILQSLGGQVERYSTLAARARCLKEVLVSGNIKFYIFWLMNMKQRSCDGGGGAQRPVWRGNAPKKTGARSAHARTRGQNPLVLVIIKFRKG
jgi:hypothetical protein